MPTRVLHWLPFAATVLLINGAIWLACSNEQRIGNGADQSAIDTSPATSTAEVDTQVVVYEAPEVDVWIRDDFSCELEPCPCNFGSWVTRDTLAMRQAPADTAGIVGVLTPGSEFTSVDGLFHVRRAGVVLVTDSVEVFVTDTLFSRGAGRRLQLAPGDRVYPFDYLAEGWHNVMRDGEVRRMEAFWAEDMWGLGIGRASAQGLMVQAPDISWWIEIERPDGSSAWVDTDDPTVLDGPNLYCARTIPSCVPGRSEDAIGCF